MPTEVEYAVSADWNAIADFNQSLEGATKDETAHLWRLFDDHINRRLRRLAPQAFAAYVEKLNVWREHDGFAVFKSADTPCFAYVAIERNGHPACLVLGFCRCYPQSQEAWWTDVIRPRLIEYL